MTIITCHRSCQEDKEDLKNKKNLKKKKDDINLLWSCQEDMEDLKNEKKKKKKKKDDNNLPSELSRRQGGSQPLYLYSNTCRSPGSRPENIKCLSMLVKCLSILVKCVQCWSNVANIKCLSMSHIGRG